MDQAKAAVKDFMAKAGHHDTTVHEKVAPAVTHETVNRTQHENVTTAVDKEVHQDHYHTSVQPVHDTEKLKEQHHHNIIPVEHRSFDHDNADEVQRRLATEQAKFRDQREHVKGEHTSSVNPIVAGEHVHHHVHETIQPVINKQTIEPHVVHTTVPIHEVHHNEGQHHSTSALPAVSMADFKKQGGVLSGREERHDGFQGEPRALSGGGALGGSSGTHSGALGRAEDRLEDRVEGRHGTSGLGGNSSTAGTSGIGGTHNREGLTDRVEDRVEGRHGTSGLGGTSSTTGTGLGGTHNRDGLDGRTGGTGIGGSGIGGNSSTTGTGVGSSTTHKPSLMDKLNPMKDANGDGKAGFMK